MTDSVLSPYVTGGTCGDPLSTPFSALTATICACPPAVDIGPCECALMSDSTSSKPNPLKITCTGKSLNDSTMASIIKKILPSLYAVYAFDLSQNNLTVVPSGLDLFSLLNYLSLASNQIAAINSGDVGLTAAVSFLDFSANQITTVAPNALPGSPHYLFHL